MLKVDIIVDLFLSDDPKLGLKVFECVLELLTKTVESVYTLYYNFYLNFYKVLTYEPAKYYL